MEMDYFKQYLRNYLLDHGFDRKDIDSLTVKYNAERANDTFETMRRSGCSVDEAIELAIQDLFIGIGDSLRETVTEILLDKDSDREKKFSSRINVDDPDFLEYWLDRFSEQFAMFEDLQMEGGLGLDPKLLEEKKEVLLQRMDKYLTIYGL